MDDWSDELKLLTVLSTVKVLLERVSKENDWSYESAKESLNVINDAIAFYFEPIKFEFPNKLSMQFTPTGPLQEISISNGWDKAYLKLAKQFDKYSYCLKRKKPYNPQIN